MFLKIPGMLGTEVKVIVRSRAEARLKTTCFRGVDRRLAGNFSQWSSLEYFFKDDFVLGELVVEVLNNWWEGDEGTLSMTLEYHKFVGWESTSFKPCYPPETLEPIKLGRNGRGLRIKQDRADLLAPLTKLITIVYELKTEDSIPTAVVHSIYPGEDVGELEGDVTERENKVFFDWNHPGA